ncbi:MAG: nitrogen fixation protein FixH [Rhodobacteraceae bacterium]|nr:nitrogen fixation protein FixH [Paracoccaceae bacterium]
MEQEITGRMVLIWMIVAFSVIIGVNLFMAFQAVGTFPGLETGNAYVASQQFQDARDAQEALGWTTSVNYARGVLRLDITGPEGPVEPAELEAILGRATHVGADILPRFTFDGRGFAAPVEVAPGYWNLRLSAMADDGTGFRQRLEFLVRQDD